MFELSYPEIINKLEIFNLPEADIVIGIAEGGSIPAALAAAKLKCDLKIIKINYRDIDNKPLYDSPVVFSPLNLNLKSLNVLLVDDVSVTGKTLQSAKQLFDCKTINTFVLKGKADYVLFPDIKECVNWPWKYSGGNSNKEK